MIVSFKNEGRNHYGRIKKIFETSTRLKSWDSRTSRKGKYLKRTRASLQQANPCRYSPRVADGRSSRHGLSLRFAWLSSSLRTELSRCHRPEACALYLQPKEWFLPPPVVGSTCFLGNGGLRDIPAGSAVYLISPFAFKRYNHCQNTTHPRVCGLKYPLEWIFQTSTDLKARLTAGIVVRPHSGQMPSLLPQQYLEILQGRRGFGTLDRYSLRSGC